MFMMGAPVILEIHCILSIWLGDTVPEYTASFVRIIILTSLLNTLNAQISTMVHASGNMQNYQVITSLFCLLILPFSYIYLKYSSNPVGVFLIMFGIIAINYVISMFILKTIMEFSMLRYIKDVVFPLMLSSAVAIVIPVLAHHFITTGLLRLLIVTLLSIISVGRTFYLISLNNEEKQFLVNTITRNNKS